MRKYTKMHVLFDESGSTLSIDLATNQVDNWFFNRAIRTNYKTSDRCLIKFAQEDSSELVSYSGYVPDFFPGKHYGDYVELHITAQGVVQKLKVTDADIDKLLKGRRRYNEDNDEDDK